MDCLNCQEQFSAVLEDSDSIFAQQSRAHLEVCPACRELFESFRQTVRHLRDLPLVAPPPGLRREIALALDAVAPTRVSRSSYWQPLVAGLSMAACCLMVMWSVVLHPMNATVSSNSSRIVQPEYSLMTPAMSTGSGPQAATPGPAPAPAAQSAPPASPAPRRVTAPRGYAPASAPRQVAFNPFPSSFGGWGPAASAGPAKGNNPATSADKPARTFAAPGEATSVEAPLHKTIGAVEFSFTPPAERVVGSPTVGVLVITSQAEADVTIRLQPGVGLRLLKARDGVLYHGALRRSEELELPVQMIAERPGAKRMQLTVEADVAGVSTDLPILIPGFSPAPAGSAQASITLVFHETQSVWAMRQMAAETGARIVIDADVEPQLISYDFSAGVPFEVALRTLCEGCSYQVQQRDGVWHVSK